MTAVPVHVCWSASLISLQEKKKVSLRDTRELRMLSVRHLSCISILMCHWTGPGREGMGWLGGWIGHVTGVQVCLERAARARAREPLQTNVRVSSSWPWHSHGPRSRHSLTFWRPQQPSGVRTEWNRFSPVLEHVTLPPPTRISLCFSTADTGNNNVHRDSHKSKHNSLSTVFFRLNQFQTWPMRTV